MIYGEINMFFGNTSTSSTEEDFSKKFCLNILPITSKKIARNMRNVQLWNIWIKMLQHIGQIQKGSKFLKRTILDPMGNIWKWMQIWKNILLMNMEMSRNNSMTYQTMGHIGIVLCCLTELLIFAKKYWFWKSKVKIFL